MGFRQPSATGAFFAQAKAGAEQQKQAREKLQKPQALGGSAAAGTQMVAATTGQQQQATKQVQETGQKAATDIKVDQGKLGTAVTTAVAPPAPTPATQPVAEMKMDTGESGDVAAVEASNKAITDAMGSTQTQIDQLNRSLSTANEQDRAAIQAEKTRLEGVLRGYQEKLSKENLGQIAGPSTFEQQMLEREQLLASEQGNVGKLAALFGKSRGKYGALESQIYGKDIEAIQEAAKTGLQEKAEAERGADVATERYSEQLKESQKGVETTLKKESDKLDILKMTPDELSKYNKQQLTDLFGADVNNLFNFEGDKPVSTKATSTRKALEDRLTQLKTEAGKFEGAKSKAQQVSIEKVQNEFFPKDQYGNELGNKDINAMMKTINSGDKLVGLAPETQGVMDKYKGNLANIENQMRNAAKRGDRAGVEQAQNLIKNLRAEWTAEIKAITQRVREGMQQPSGPTVAEQIISGGRPITAENVGRQALAVATGGISEAKPVRQAASWVGSKVKKLFGR